jgi:hypothetical protein
MALARLHRRLAAALALLLAGPLSMAAPASPAALSCGFQAATDATGRVALQFTLHNAGTQDLHLLRWGSPFEGAWFGPFVRVSTAAGELPFQGAMRKRGDPSAGDYLLLRAGQTLAANLALNDAYALPPTGLLVLRAGWRWHDAMATGNPPRPRAAHQGLDQDCGEVTLTR